MHYTLISAAMAKKLYCHGHYVYITTDKRSLFRLPASYEYGSHAPAEELFYRGIPAYEGEVRFYVPYGVVQTYQIN